MNSNEGGMEYRNPNEGEMGYVNPNEGEMGYMNPGGGTPLYGLYRYVPRNRVWFLEVLDP